MLEFLKAYQRGFKILDDYDHHTLEVPKGQKDDSFKSSISTIYKSFRGEDLYPTLEDKASALLYFIVKNHSFIDGNKRIGTTSRLEDKDIMMQLIKTIIK